MMSTWKKVYIGLGVVVFTLFFVFPLYWLFTTSFKPTKLIFSASPVFIFTPTISHYSMLLGKIKFLPYFKNSMVVATSSTGLSVFFGSLAAYSLSRIKTTFTQVSLIILILIKMLPPIIFIVPLYIFYRNFYLLNTYFGLILAYQVYLIPFTIWIMWTFFDNVPDELIEASKIDGCSFTGTFFRVVLPLSTAALGVTIIFCFLYSWNEFMFALILTGRSTHTVPVGVATLVGETEVDWGAIAAGGVILVIPLMIIISLVNRHLIRGFTAGALKG